MTMEANKATKNISWYDHRFSGWSAYRDDRFPPSSLYAEDAWLEVLDWQAEAARAGEVRRVACGPCVDVFCPQLGAVINDLGEDLWVARDRVGVTSDPSRAALITGVEPPRALPLTVGHLRQRMFRELVPATPNLLWLFVTEHPENIRSMVPSEWTGENRENFGGWPANVMTGAAVSDQRTLDRSMPYLLEVTGLHFLYFEYLTEPVDFSDVTNRRDAAQQLGRPALAGIDWVVVGGDASRHHNHTPLYPDWVRSLRNQCAEVDVPFFFGGWGDWAPCLEIGGVLEHAETGELLTDDAPCWYDDAAGVQMARCGRELAGRTLDGWTHDALPMGVLSDCAELAAAVLADGGGR